jgi:hypothetical protein
VRVGKPETELFVSKSVAGPKQGRDDLPRMRAALRLVFDGEQADMLVAPLATGVLDAAGLRSVMRRARTQFDLERWTSRVRRGGLPDRPLPPGGGAPANAALAMAIHIGLGWPVAAIAEALESTPERVGADLWLARRAVDASMRDTCVTSAAVIGWLHDPALESGERLRFLAHLRGCTICQTNLERQQALDADLSAEVVRLRAELPVNVRSRRRGVVTLWPLAAILLLVVGIVIGSILTGRLLGTQAGPLPLVTGTDPKAATAGWLLRPAHDGRLEAFHLSSGRTHPLDVGSNQPNAQPFLSPNGSQLATWNMGGNDPDGRPVLEVAPLDGPLGMRQTFDTTGVYIFPCGWLGESTFLLARTPLPRPFENTDAWYARAAAESELIGVDSASGAERLLFTGNVANAIPSPDGSRIVLYRPFDHRWPGQTVELRALTADGVGELLWTSEPRVVGGVFWAGDSSRFYFGRMTAADIRMADWTRNWTTSPTEPDPTELASVSRDGARETVVAGQPQRRVEVVSVAPHGATIVYRTIERDARGQPVNALWRVARDSAPQPLLPEGYVALGGPPLWSPDGTTLLVTVQRRFYLPTPEDDVFRNQVYASLLVAVGPDGALHVVWSDFGRLDTPLYGWLPSDALPVPEAGVVAGAAAAPQPVTTVPAEHQLAAGARTGPDSRHVLVQDPATGDTVVWNSDRRRGRRLQQGMGDSTWLPSGNWLLGTFAEEQGGPANRLVIYAPEFSRSLEHGYDFRRFDPAGVGSRSGIAYASPVASPDLAHIAFFVVDNRRSQVELWVAGWDVSPQPVAAWVLPSERLLDVPQVALWADARTLLYARQDDWEEGLPQRVTLARVSVADSVASTEPLLHLRAGGRDRGLELRELTLSADGTQLAYRLRHYGQRSIERGRTDTLHVLPVSDLRSSMELARGTPGDGLSWSPDGRWIAAGLRQRVALISVDGWTVHWLTPADRVASHPLWLGPHEVWLSLSGDTTHLIWRVRVD